MSSVRPEIEAAVADFVNRLEGRGIRAERVYLFGSYLKGTANEWSDLDLVVVSADFARLDLWQTARVTGPASAETSRATGYSIETHAKTPEQVATCHPASFLADVLKDAVVVYERPAAVPGR